MSMFCFSNLKLSTAHMLVILNGCGCEGDETENDPNSDLISFDIDITFDKTKFCSFPESCNLSAKILETKEESNPESKNATALTEFYPWERITGSN